MDTATEIFEKKRKALQDEIKQVMDGTHPELVERLKAIEEECDEWLNFRIPFAVKQMEHDAQLQYEASVELAKKRYSESVDEIREKLLHQLKEERAQIEYDYYNDELDSSDGLFLTPPRKLRPRFNDAPSPCDVEQNAPKPVPTLNTSLSNAEIEQHLRLIRSFAVSGAKSKAEEESGLTAEVASAEEGTEGMAGNPDDLGNTKATVTHCRRPSPSSTHPSNFSGVEAENRSEQNERSPLAEVRSPERKTHRVGAKAAPQSTSGPPRQAALETGGDRAVAISEPESQVTSTGADEIHR